MQSQNIQYRKIIIGQPYDSTKYINNGCKLRSGKMHGI